MAFVQLQRDAEDSSEVLLVNTAQIVSAQVQPYSGSGNAAYQLEIVLVGRASLVAYFETQQAAQTAYTNLSNGLMPEAQTIAIY